MIEMLNILLISLLDLAYKKATFLQSQQPKSLAIFQNIKFYQVQNIKPKH